MYFSKNNIKVMPYWVDSAEKNIVFYGLPDKSQEVKGLKDKHFFI